MFDCKDKPGEKPLTGHRGSVCTEAYSDRRRILIRGVFTPDKVWSLPSQVTLTTCHGPGTTPTMIDES